MNNPEDSLGGRLPLLGKTELNGAQSTLYKAMEKDLLPWAKKSGFQAATEVWKSAYELYAHTAVADKAGLDPEVIHALAAGHTPENLPDDQRVAHEFARRLAAEHGIDPGLYAQAEETFGRKGEVDMIHLTSLYMGTSALLNALAIPVPGGNP